MFFNYLVRILQKHLYQGNFCSSIFSFCSGWLFYIWTFVLLARIVVYKLVREILTQDHLRYTFIVSILDNLMFQIKLVGFFWKF